jgi:hypothetical protein
MARTERSSTIAALIVCLLGTQWSGTLYASEEERSSGATPGTSAAAVSVGESVVNATDVSLIPPSTKQRSQLFTLDDDVFATSAPVGSSGGQIWRSALKLVPVEAGTFAQRGRERDRGGRGDRNRAAQVELVLGAVASIAGTAVLVYAHRPECSTNPTADGCGYGTKVVGGAILSAGIFSLVAAAVTWR